MYRQIPISKKTKQNETQQAFQMSPDVLSNLNSRYEHYCGLLERKVLPLR